MLNDFRARVRDVMRVRGWNQREIARRLDVREATVSDWLTRGAPQLETLLKMPGALEVDGHWLLTGEGQMLRTNPTEAQSFFDEVAALVDEARGVTELSRVDEAREAAERADIADRMAQLHDRAGGSGPPRGERRRIPRKARDNLG